MSDAYTQGGVGYVPPHLWSREKFPVDSHGGGGYFCAPQALYHRDILLFSRAIFMAMPKGIDEYCVLTCRRFCYQSKPGFVLLIKLYFGKVPF